jgi:hypothetical protein
MKSATAALALSIVMLSDDVVGVDRWKKLLVTVK